MRKELIDIYNDITNSIDSLDNNDQNYQKKSSDKKLKSFHGIVEFSSPIYVARAVSNDYGETKENKCTLTLVRKNNLAEDIHVT